MARQHLLLLVLTPLAIWRERVLAQRRAVGGGLRRWGRGGSTDGGHRYRWCRARLPGWQGRPLFILRPGHPMSPILGSMIRGNGTGSEIHRTALG